MGEGGAVAHGLHRLRVQSGPDRSAVQPVGVFIKLGAHLAHEGLQCFLLAGGQLADGFDAVLSQQLLSRAAYIQQVPHRQWPDDGAPVFPGNNGGGVRFFIIAAQLGKDLVEADADRQGQSQLPFHPLPDGVRQRLGVPAEQVEGVGHVQPAFVDAEGLR